MLAVKVTDPSNCRAKSRISWLVRKNTDSSAVARKVVYAAGNSRLARRK